MVLYNCKLTKFYSRRNLSEIVAKLSTTIKNSNIIKFFNTKIVKALDKSKHNKNINIYINFFIYFLIMNLFSSSMIMFFNIWPWFCSNICTFSKTRSCFSSIFWYVLAFHLVYPKYSLSTIYTPTNYKTN